ncbi:MAG: nucleotide pyrophosphohydrolase [Flavobacteriales bacterium]|nr:nucleotide pyrophosphohydrolase [Flavobacteriales bacterium]
MKQLLLDRRLRSSILTRRALAGRTITARAIRSRLAEAPLEHTQWAKDADLPTLASEHRDALAEEMADIATLRLYPEPVEGYLAHDLRVDLETAVRQKLVKNAAKYPVEKAKGVATKYDRL